MKDFRHLPKPPPKIEVPGASCFYSNFIFIDQNRTEGFKKRNASWRTLQVQYNHNLTHPQLIFVFVYIICFISVVYQWLHDFCRCRTLNKNSSTTNDFLKRCIRHLLKYQSVSSSIVTTLPSIYHSQSWPTDFGLQRT